MNRRNLASLAGLMFSLGACDAQEDPSYQGDPLLEVQGTITGAAAEGSKMEAMLVWSKNGGQYLPSPTRIPVEATAFPADFSLVVRQPPPDAVVTNLADYGYPDEARFAFAYLAIMRTGVALETEEDVVAAILGGSREHVALWVDRDVSATSILGRTLGFSVSAGYHLLRARAFTEQESAARRECRAQAEQRGDDPDSACPSWKMHLDLADGERATLYLSDDVGFPDLS